MYYNKKYSFTILDFKRKIEYSKSMKHTLFNHIPLDKIPPFTLRKAGLLAGGLLSVSLCVTDIREKVGNILFGGNPQSESVIVTPNKTTEAVERTVAE